MKLKHQRAPRRYAQSDVMHKDVLRYKKFVVPSFICFAILVVFVTAYSLILPAKTQAGLSCKIAEHSHSDECYISKDILICTEPDEEHIHNSDCYEIEKTLTCETEIHIHNANCYSEISNDETTDENSSDSVEGDTPSNEPDLSQYTDFAQYIAKEKGTITSTLYDKNSNIIDNIYEASGEGYTYHFSVESNRILPGTYIYYLPEGITVDIASKIGEISNKSSVIGSYVISENSSYILFTFDKVTGEYQSIRGEISLVVEFEEIINSAVSKEGHYISEDGLMDGFFHFEINAQIPANRHGVPKREWKLVDRSEISDQWVYDFEDSSITKDLKISITYGDVEDEEIFNIKDVYKNPDISIAYYVDPNTKALYLVNRCKCEGELEHCANSSDGKCTFVKGYDGWCTCWSKKENTNLTIKYKTAVDGYAGEAILGNQNLISQRESNQYENRVILTGNYINSAGYSMSDTKKSTTVVEYSTLLDKTETKKASAEGGYESVFTVTLNEKKADFSKIDTDGDEKYDNKVIVIDTMQNLKYISGSMSIIIEDLDGNETELEPGEDFTVNVEQTEDGNTLEINLSKLGRYKYTIIYSTSVYNPSDDSMIEIVNNVSLNLYGQIYEYSNPTYRYSRRFQYDDNWDYLKYEINILKVDYYNKETYLPGAVFGLYSADGNKMAEEETDDKGSCIFKTNAEQGLIYQNDVMYYITELSAPKGYELDTLKHWFYFSESENQQLEDELLQKYPGADIHYIGLTGETDYIFDLKITNEKLFALPETGGKGNFGFIITGAAIILLSLGCIIIKEKRKSGLI